MIRYTKNSQQIFINYRPYHRGPVYWVRNVGDHSPVPPVDFFFCDLEVAKASVDVWEVLVP
jgi:hypothetical protein